MATVIDHGTRDKLPDNHPLKASGVLILDYVHPSSLETASPEQRAMTPEEEALEELQGKKALRNRFDRFNATNPSK